MAGLLAFHAHPDDETTSTGGTLARYAEAGEQVVVVTATDGAVGEIHNYDNPEELKPRLAEIRSDEMAGAARVLGITHHEFLGYRDSGMMGTEDNGHPDAFWNADFMEATGRLVHLIRRFQPEVVIAYDPFGGYGHPDHIQVNRIGTAAFFGADDVGRFPPAAGEGLWTPCKLYWVTYPRSRTHSIRQALHEAGEITDEEFNRRPAGGIPDEDITAWVDVRDFVDRKFEAWAAHRSQIPEDWWLFRVPQEARPTVFGRESFMRIASRVDAPDREDDLFAGLR
ncbi:MAG: PIG-L family deacetylase [Acidimicrobiia bacterium]